MGWCEVWDGGMGRGDGMGGDGVRCGVVGWVGWWEGGGWDGWGWWVGMTME